MRPNRKIASVPASKKMLSVPMDELWNETYGYMEPEFLKGNYALVDMVYRRFLELYPAHSAAFHCLGLSLKNQGRLNEAEQCYREAVRHNPSAGNVFHNLGLLLKECNRLDEAHAAFEEALRLKLWYPNQIETQSIHLMQYLCKWDGLRTRIKRLRRTFSASAPNDSSGPKEIPNPFILMAIGASSDEQQRCGRQVARDQLDPLAANRAFDFAGRNVARKRMRIGYLSADLHEHATAYLMAAMFEFHDRLGFETTAYSNGPDDDSPMRHRLRSAFDHFIDVRDMSAKDVAEKIHGDGIDILVDLKGYTAGAINQVMGHRPAPVQVQFLGFPGTMGSTTVDYVIADQFVVPKGDFQFYDEKIVHLPHCYQPNDPERKIGPTPTRAEVGLPETGIVFCSFNQTYKITPFMFDIWMRILAAVPGSVLWILESNRWAGDNLRREAQARGIDGGRLIFAPYLRLSDHLGRFKLADIFLDTLPVNAHTTASDALWAGVPVLTCPGQTFASRVAASLLHAMELPELVMPSLDRYEQEAIDLALQPTRLSAVKAKINAKRTTAPLFDIEQFTRHLETAYQMMWDRYVRGEAPAAMSIPSSGIDAAQGDQEKQMSALELADSMASMTAPKRRFHIVTISLPGYSHSAAFAELIEAIAFGLQSFGYLVTSGRNSFSKSATNILFGAHLVTEQFASSIPDGSVIYNTEQVDPSSPWQNAVFLRLIQKFETWDYSARNVERFAHVQLASNVRLVPVGYMPQLTRIAPAAIQDIDVLFYGCMNERRAHVIDALRARGLNVYTAFNCYGRERDALIARSKVILNVHFYEAKIFEVVRVSYLLANQKAVVSEIDEDTDIDPRFRDAVAAVPYDSLVDECVSLVANDARRAVLEQRGFEIMTGIPQDRYLHDVLITDPTAQKRPKIQRTSENLPVKINLGSGKNYLADHLNIDINPYWKPDAVIDLSADDALDRSYDSPRFGSLQLPREYFDFIQANDVLEHVPNLTAMMTTCLELLKIGGRFSIKVPYDLSYGAWQDPTHVRAFNERSWLYYTDWFWYLGWRDCRFDQVQLLFVLSPIGQALEAEGLPVAEILLKPRAVDAMHVTLQKRKLNDDERRLVDQYLQR